MCKATRKRRAEFEEWMKDANKRKDWNTKKKKKIAKLFWANLVNIDKFYLCAMHGDSRCSEKIERKVAEFAHNHNVPLDTINKKMDANGIKAKVKMKRLFEKVEYDACTPKTSNSIQG